MTLLRNRRLYIFRLRLANAIYDSNPNGYFWSNVFVFATRTEITIKFIHSKSKWILINFVKRTGVYSNNKTCTLPPSPSTTTRKQCLLTHCSGKWGKTTDWIFNLFKVHSVFIDDFESWTRIKYKFKRNVCKLPTNIKNTP